MPRCGYHCFELSPTIDTSTSAAKPHGCPYIVLRIISSGVAEHVILDRIQLNTANERGACKWKFTT